MRMLAVVGDASSRTILSNMSSWLSGVEGVLKSMKGLINSLKHLVNTDAVAGLNSQQKADFLRGASYNRSGRNLAKRAAKAEMTPDELAAEGIRYLATADIPMDEE